MSSYAPVLSQALLLPHRAAGLSIPTPASRAVSSQRRFAIMPPNSNLPSASTIPWIFLLFTVSLV